ncbi:MAG: hypothetical protein M5U34_30195 [Chloroflexi bacterium]|nr:hypothetical protein [Chloroflexota bacterium]
MVNQAASIKASPPDLMNGYDIEVTAGVHEVYVVQDNAYANTEWTAFGSSDHGWRSVFHFYRYAGQRRKRHPPLPRQHGVQPLPGGRRQ